MKFKITSLITSFLIIISMAHDVQAQTVANIPLEEINSTYLFVNPVSRLLNNRINLSIQFGQEIGFGDMRDTGLLGPDEKPMKFYSVVHGLNYLYAYGYEYHDAIVDTTSGGATYVLIRKQE